MAPAMSAAKRDEYLYRESCGVWVPALGRWTSGRYRSARAGMLEDLARYGEAERTLARAMAMNLAVAELPRPPSRIKRFIGWLLRR